MINFSVRLLKNLIKGNLVEIKLGNCFKSADSPKDLEFRKYILKEDEDEIIRGEYEDTCYYYDNPEYHSNQSTDEELINQPVRILEMI